MRSLGRCLGGAVIAALLVGAGPARPQEAQTLAGIRADLEALAAQIGALRQELVAGGAGASAPVAGTALERMNAIEAQLAGLTAKTEALEMRINRVVQDGSNRLGDLEFRLCEIEPGCDISRLGPAGTLGGDAGSAPAAVPAPSPAPPPGGAELAVGEKADFDRAREVLDQGDFRRAADLLAAFAQTYPGSPLSSEANYWRGEALSGLGDTEGAARAWLASFSEAPRGPKAADALLRLGLALDKLGQRPEACVTLAEVGNRFPGSAAASQAAQARSGMGCM